MPALGGGERAGEALLDVDITCASRDVARRRSSARSSIVCGYQRQKQIEANIWFAAHECMVHEMPKAFGNVGLVMIDESPLDAFMFGVDVNDKMTLVLDDLRQTWQAPATQGQGSSRCWGWHTSRRRSAAGPIEPTQRGAPETA